MSGSLIARPAGTFARQPWGVLLEATADSDAQSLNPNSRPAESTLLNVQEAPFVDLRAFLTNAANEQATIDVIYWFVGGTRGLLASRLRVVAGAGTLARHPIDNVSGTTYYEADQAQWLGGLLRPQVRASADGSCLIQLDTLGALLVQVRLQDLDTATKVIVAGRPGHGFVEQEPERFHGKLECSAATFTDEVFHQCEPIDSTDDLPVPGSGQEYRIYELQSQGDANLGITLLNANGDVWGLYQTPWGFGSVPFPFGLRFGDNLQPKVTATKAGGGNWTGRIDIFGVKVPVGSP